MKDHPHRDQILLLTLLLLLLSLHGFSDVQSQQMQVAMFLLINKCIVEGIIGDLLFDPDAPSTTIDDEIVGDNDIEASHQRAALVNYHTRQHFLSEFTLQQEDDAPEAQGSPPAVADEDQDSDADDVAVTELELQHQRLRADSALDEEEQSAATPVSTVLPSTDSRP